MFVFVVKYLVLVLRFLFVVAASWVILVREGDIDGLDGGGDDRSRLWI